jgi:hypothetical protein
MQQQPLGLKRRLAFALRLQPQLDQPSEGFREIWHFTEGLRLTRGSKSTLP